MKDYSTMSLAELEAEINLIHDQRAALLDEARLIVPFRDEAQRAAKAAIIAAQGPNQPKAQGIGL